jgi:hypothetical protein
MKRAGAVGVAGVVLKEVVWQIRIRNADEATVESQGSQVWCYMYHC